MLGNPTIGDHEHDASSLKHKLPLVRYVHDDLTGKVLASRQFGFGAMEWDWIAAAVAEFNHCRSEDVDLIETDDGEIITVHGKPVGRLEDN